MEGHCGGVAYQDMAQVRLCSFCATCFMLTVEGRCGGGIAFQDTAQVRPCSLFLDFLSRKILESNPPTPASISM